MIYRYHFFYLFNFFFSGELGGFQREESQDVIRDIDWSTRNVMLGYDVAGTFVNLVYCTINLLPLACFVIHPYKLL